MEETIIPNNIPPFLSGYVKITDRSHARYGQYGKISNRGRISVTLSGIKTYVIIMLRDNEGVELYDTQFRPTETIQEARIVAV